MIGATANVKDFVVDIERFVAKAKGRGRAFSITFIQDLNEEVIRATPVKTGFLRGSWHASVNSLPSPEAGGGGLLRMNLVAAQVVPGDIFRAANGAAYAMRLEFGFTGADSLGRQYNQAPRAFVRGTLDRARSIAAAAARKVAKL